MHFIEHFVESIIDWFGGNIWLGLLIAPILGILMSFMPCCLASAGMVANLVDKEISLANPGKKSKKNSALLYSVIFAAGGAAIFFLIGLFVKFIGDALSSIEWAFHFIVGGALIGTSVYYLVKNARSRHSCCGHEHFAIGHSVSAENTQTHDHCCDQAVYTPNGQMSQLATVAMQGSPQVEEVAKDVVVASVSSEIDSVIAINNGTGVLSAALVRGHGKPECNDCQHLEHCDCNCKCHKKKHTSKVKVFGYGMIGAIFNIPCNVPALIAIFAFAASVDSLLVGLLMITLYVVGHSILPVVAGVGTRFIKSMSTLKKAGKLVEIIKVIIMAVLILFAIFIIYQGVVELLGGVHID